MAKQQQHEWMQKSSGRVRTSYIKFGSPVAVGSQTDTSEMSCCLSFPQYI